MSHVVFPDPIETFERYINMSFEELRATVKSRRHLTIADDEPRSVMVSWLMDDDGFTVGVRHLCDKQWQELKLA